MTTVVDLVQRVGSAASKKRLQRLLTALSRPTPLPHSDEPSSSNASPAEPDAHTALCATRDDIHAAHTGSHHVRAALEALYVAAIGYADPRVQDEAVVLLNVLYDGHTLQLEDSLPVTVSTVGESPVVNLTPPRDSAFPRGVLTAKVYVWEGGNGGAMREMSLTLAFDRSARTLSLAFPQFDTPGFVDWIVGSTDATDQRALESRRMAGRFVVHKAGARKEFFVEMPVDEIGASWDEQTGRLQTRGSFDAVVAALPEVKMAGATSLYLMGALERPADEDMSSPFVVARRDAPASVLGGAKPFSDLTSEIKRLGMTPIVDAIDRVSKTRAHRQYTDACVYKLDSSGELRRHSGTDGQENEWEETCLLNYRDVTVWNQFVDDVKELASSYGVGGVRLDNAQSMPVIMKIDEAEMYRLDVDGEYHHSERERCLGRVVLPNTATGYWSTETALFRGYPNPLLVKVVRTMWSEYPGFMVIAESHFHREAQIAASACIPHSIRVPQILASIGGKSLRRDGSLVQRMHDSKRSSARTLSRLYKSDRVSMPKNPIVTTCTCTHTSPYPALIYGRRSWLAVDLLYFLPHVPMLLFGEDSGRAYRHNMAPVVDTSAPSAYDVNYDAVLPRSPKKRAPSPAPSGSQGNLRNLGTLSTTGLAPAGMGTTRIGLSGETSTISRDNSDISMTPNGGSAFDTMSDNRSGEYSLPAHIAALDLSDQSHALGPGRAGVDGGFRGLDGSVGSGVGSPGQRGDAGMDPGSGSEGGTPHTLLRGASSVSSRGLPRRGSMSSLGLRLPSPVPGKAGMVRSVSKHDMQGLNIRNMSSEELRKMSELEDAARADIGPETGYDLAQIKAHYSHRNLLRQEYEMLRDGSFCVLSPDPQSQDTVFSFARFNDKDVAIVAMNTKDGREEPQHAGGAFVELDLRVLWDNEIGFPSSVASKHGDLFKFVNLFTGDDYFPGEYYTLEEIVFRKCCVHVPPLGIVVLKLEQVAVYGSDDDQGKRLYKDHFSQCMSRLQESDASFSLKDARENHAIASLARAASDSLHSFACALERTRSALVEEGCDTESVQAVLQLCLQRASALLPSVLYENAIPAKDFEAPTGERINAYLSLLSTVASAPDLLEITRTLVQSSAKIGPLVFLTAELGRFSTAGGLGVMVDELTKGLAKLGLEVYVVSPYYAVNRKDQADYLGDKIKWTRNLSINIGTGLIDVGIFEGVEEGVNLIFLERKDMFTKVYASPGTAIRHLQNIVLMSLGSLEIFCQKAISPALVITNDWLPSLSAGYARNGHFGDYFMKTSFFHLIHNLGDTTYEGRCFPDQEGDDMGYIHRLPRHLIVDPLWSRTIANPSRTALLCSDSWGTVSPSYMKELLSSHDLSPLLQIARRPFAFPNGIPKVERETLLLSNGPKDHVSAKAELQARYFNMETPDPSIPLFAFVGRVTAQKGVHLILNAVDELIHHTGGRIQILVGGPANYQDPYAAGCANHMYDLRYRHPACFWAAPEDFFTDGPLVNLGADFGVMPSLFEPGGIVQQEFFVAGTPVVAFKTGGLKDTVHEWQVDEGEGNGFLFEDYSHPDFVTTMKRALRVFTNPLEYSSLRKAAYLTTIDVSQVAWAWSSEFHRMRNAIYSHEDLQKAEYASVASAEAGPAKKAGLIAESARPVDVSWPGEVPAGAQVYVRGSWDNWASDYRLSPAEGKDAGHVVQLMLQSGSYRYKFRVASEWLHDPERPHVTDDGKVNNVLEIV